MSTTLKSTAEFLDKKYPFTLVCDSRGRRIIGLWQRNRRFYCQLEVPGKGTRRIPLFNEDQTPARTVQQATRRRASF